MLRVLSGLMILLVALLLGALWGAAFVAESPAHAAEPLAHLARSRQLQAAGLFVAAPMCLVASILVFARSRHAIEWCLLTGAYIVGSLLLVMHSPAPLLQQDRAVAWVYGSIAAVPLLLGCLSSLLRRRGG